MNYNFVRNKIIVATRNTLCTNVMYTHAVALNLSFSTQNVPPHNRLKLIILSFSSTL